ncbi:hypothetical protein D9613_007723 [Agrocybe pediades]|uniref:Uncharacterized protein n=1 Tax=Agrocybe pediades TaxID=84607 RepID=A0A8H4QNY9_9AGAR|nr:hypothetical protein D9613_007723 [Agrocybe pediades]KAF9565189.1 hypothetical protein CPC08DRAFT_704727 [Agrocybe pediades]
MSQSLSEECTPLKKEYDSCFNSWFEGYLEPAIVAGSTPEKRAEHSKRKADEFDAKCGKIWRQYKACVTQAVKDKGLDKLLEQARQENPLVDPIPPPPGSNSNK